MNVKARLKRLENMRGNVEINVRIYSNDEEFEKMRAQHEGEKDYIFVYLPDNNRD